jgi:hypothetical protein
VNKLDRIFAAIAIALASAAMAFFVCWKLGIGIGEPTAAADCYCISLDDTLAEHYCTEKDYDDRRVKVNNQIPASYDVMVCEGDYVEVAGSYVIESDGTRRYILHSWTIKRPEASP